jgi:hypothetical protein
MSRLVAAAAGSAVTVAKTPTMAHKSTTTIPMTRARTMPNPLGLKKRRHCIAWC